MVSGILQHLDAGRLWGDAGAVVAALLIVRRSCAEEQQRYLLFSALVQHLASSALTTSDKQVQGKVNPCQGFNGKGSGFKDLGV